jgi:hypothetical protein
MKSILQCHWESADRRSKIAQIILPRSRVNDVLIWWTVIWSWIRSSKSTNGFRQETMLRNGTGSGTLCQLWPPGTRNRGQMHQYNIKAPFGRIAIDTAGPFTWSERKPVLSDRYRLFYKVARSLLHSQSRGFDCGGSISYQLLLPLWCTMGAT